MIIRGQGTQTIIISTEGLEDTGITATVNFKGLPKNCPATLSENSHVDSKPKPKLFAEFGKLKRKDIEKRVADFLEEISKDPTSTGYIINLRKGFAGGETGKGYTEI